VPRYCKTAHPTDNKPRSVKSATRLHKTCIEFGMSAALKGWLTDGGLLWDRAVVCGIGKKRRVKELSLHIGLNIGFKC